MIVMKFGGTSVKDAEAIDRACAIVADRIELNPLVVVSALAGVTSNLFEAARLAGGGSLDRALGIVATLRERHTALLPSLALEFAGLAEALDKVHAAGTLTPAMKDTVVSYGEILSAKIFDRRLSRHAKTVHLDPRECIITDRLFTKANPLLTETEQRVDARLRPLIEQGRVVVMEGYLGSTTSGETTTLGRGGSDYSAALIGACLGAEEIQIWTDVDGMMTADPRIVRDAWKIKQMSFDEASELAYFGAKVLHPSALLPAVEKGITVRVLNSRKPDRSGTSISAHAPTGRNPIKSFACKKGLTVVTVTSSRMLMAHGFLRALFEVFDRHGASVDVITTSEVSVSLTMDDDRPLEKIVADLGKLGDVRAERGMALVCMVGTNLRNTPGIAARAFGCLNDINIRMISQGASNINLSFVVDESQAGTVLRRLHERFFQEFEPDIFERV